MFAGCCLHTQGRPGDGVGGHRCSRNVSHVRLPLSYGQDAFFFFFLQSLFFFLNTSSMKRKKKKKRQKHKKGGNSLHI